MKTLKAMSADELMEALISNDDDEEDDDRSIVLPGKQVSHSHPFSVMLKYDQERKSVENGTDEYSDEENSSTGDDNLDDKSQLNDTVENDSDREIKYVLLSIIR